MTKVMNTMFLASYWLAFFSDFFNHSGKGLSWICSQVIKKKTMTRPFITFSTRLKVGAKTERRVGSL
jgi:hypothetical protein